MSSHIGRVAAALRLAGAIVPLALTAGCSTDILDVGVDLQPRTYSADFGNTQGTIPTVPCDPSQADACLASAGAVQGSVPNGTAQAQLACDGSTDRCFAQAHAEMSFPIDVLQEDDFVTRVKRDAVVIVRSIDIAYRVPINTLTFDVPEIRVSVGPAGSTSAGDAGVVPIGSTVLLPAAAIIGEPPQHLTVADDTPARSLIENSIMNQQTFVIIATMDPRLEAGAAIPAGQLQVDLSPHLTLGLPH
jgi:hypothetical protein